MTTSGKQTRLEPELKMIPSDLRLFDNLSVSSGGQESDLSGPFSEYERSEVYIEKRKSADVQNMDIYAYFSFSQEFKSAMESVKKEIPVAIAGPDECPAAGSPRKDSKIQADLENRAARLLREIAIEFRKRSVIEDEDKKSGSALDPSKGNRKGKSKDEKKVVEEDRDDEYFDTMSGYWRMLSAYEDFQISPPYYNAFENESPHWLETKLIPFEVMENARKKCLHWLKENFQTY